MATALTKIQLITKGQLYLDDGSELSTQEWSDLFDKMYNKVNVSRLWEGLKKEFTGTTSTSFPYVSLPEDFLNITENRNYTTSNYQAEFPVIFRGTTYSPYQVVSWSDRRQYRESGQHAYIDYPNRRLYFTKQPAGTESVEFDYYSSAESLTNNDSPWFPAEFHDVLYHLMVADDYMIQQSDKAKSYKNENEDAAKEILKQMAIWNSRLVQL